MRNLMLLNLLLCGAALAQSGGPGIYKLNFTVHEAEAGKRVSTRGYSMLVEAGGRGFARVGGKVAVPVQPGPMPSYQFYEVGLNLECRVAEKPSGLSLDTSLDISDLESPDPKASTGVPPQVRSVRLGALSVVELGKSTVISGVDDAVGKRRYELEVTAQKVK